MKSTKKTIKKRHKHTVMWERDQRRIVFPVFINDPYQAIRKIENDYELPKHRVIGYEVKIYTGKDGFTGYPEVYIER